MNGTLYSILALTCLLSTQLRASDAAWLDNFETAKQKAEREGKAILACFTGSDWCPYCIKLENEVLSKDAFSKWAKDKVVLLMVDFPRRKTLKAEVAKQNAELSAQYQVGGLPTVLLLAADGEKLGKTGYNSKPVDEWVKICDYYIDPYLAKAAQNKSSAAADPAKASARKESSDAERAAALKARRKELESDGYREWSDKTGRKIFAKYVATAAGVVGLISDSGEKLRIKLTDFSKDDQAYIRSLRESN